MNDLPGDYTFLHEMKVRDYECDMLGIVNNGWYLHYVEHARHEYLESKGINLEDFVKDKISLLITTVKIDYKASLRTRDKFIVGVRAEAMDRDVGMHFIQGIWRKRDMKLAAKATTSGVAINERKEKVFPELFKKLI